MSKDRAAGHYSRAGQGKRKRVRHPNPPPAAPPKSASPVDEVDTTVETPVATSRVTPIPGRPVVTGSTLSRLNLRPSATTSTLPTNYDYIVHDLKRIGILTTAGVLILVVLAVVLR